MIGLGVTLNSTAARLLTTGRLDVDYAVWYGGRGAADVGSFVGYKPLLLHDVAAQFWLNYADPFDPALMAEARHMLDATRTPYLSTGVGASAEPQAHRGSPYREADASQRQSREVVRENVIRHARRLQDWAGVPLLLENYNYHATNAYEYVCEPDFFRDVIDAAGCGMLLDLGHARISAYNMARWHGDTEGYLSALPLDRVREIHFSRPGWKDGERVDLHQPVCRDDLDWLAWVLDRSPAERVTLEIEATDESTLLDQIATLRAFLAAR